MISSAQGLRLELAAVDVRRLGELAIAFDEAEDAFGAPRDGLGRGLGVAERRRPASPLPRPARRRSARARSPASASS